VTDPGEVPGTTTAAAVLERCELLATHSSLPGGLIQRVNLSTEHAAVNALAATWMQEAGMTTWQDAAGNQCGRLEGAEPGLPALLLGSHLDTVPSAGKYDGILGVLTAIAVVHRIRSSGRVLPFALEVVAFADEEGTRFGRALIGSRAFAGTFDPAWWDLHDENGVSLRQAFLDFGLDPAKVGDAARRPTSRRTSSRGRTSKTRTRRSASCRRSRGPGASSSPSRGGPGTPVRPTNGGATPSRVRPRRSWPSSASRGRRS
jgi:allantoate deiminase